MSTVDFERRYREDPDPWGYEHRPYERDKYAATLAACGDGPFASALELGGSIGVFSARLAPRCAQLLTIDLAPTAVAAARRRLAPFPHAHALVGRLPDDLPPGRYDLVVASEVLYYMTETAVRATLARLEPMLAGAGRVVAVHWRPAGPERPMDAAGAHALVAAQPWLAHVTAAHTDDYRLDVWERS